MSSNKSNSFFFSNLSRQFSEQEKEKDQSIEENEIVHDEVDKSSTEIVIGIEKR